MDKPSPSRVVTVAPVAQHHQAPLGLRSVAVFELIKGVLFFVLALGALSLVHRDVDKVANLIMHNLHLDPAWHFSKLLAEQVAKINDARLRLFAVFGFALAAIRTAEAYGLWHERAWAEWFAVISAGIYLPLEMSRYWKDPKIGGAFIFLVNIAIVIYLARLLAGNRRRKIAIRQAAGV